MGAGKWKEGAILLAAAWWMVDGRTQDAGGGRHPPGQLSSLRENARSRRGGVGEGVRNTQETESKVDRCADGSFKRAGAGRWVGGGWATLRLCVRVSLGRSRCGKRRVPV